MIDFVSNNIESLLTFIAGGGLATLLKMRSIKKQAEAEAMKSVQDVYQETIADLRSDKDEMKKENAEMRNTLNELRKEVHQNTKDINLLKSYKCTVLDCTLRKRD